MLTEHQIIVNGLEITASYHTETVEQLFRPLLMRLTDMYHRQKRRIVVFIAAPPAVGKTTLTLFLEQLSRKDELLEPVQAIGLDGFHYHADYLARHSVWRDRIELPMQQVKGSPETFDAEALEQKLRLIHAEDISWPVYSRKLHDVIEDAQQVTENIILLEGNWLLLEDERWKCLRQYSDYAILIRAKEEMLRERLIGRKVQGGLCPEEAEAFYEQSDRRNIQRVLNASSGADEVWHMWGDGDYRAS